MVDKQAIDAMLRLDMNVVLISSILLCATSFPLEFEEDNLWSEE
jgi:hypothetical protein